MLNLNNFLIIIVIILILCNLNKSNLEYFKSKKEKKEKKIYFKPHTTLCDYDFSNYEMNEPIYPLDINKKHFVQAYNWKNYNNYASVKNNMNIKGNYCAVHPYKDPQQSWDSLNLGNNIKQVEVKFK